VIRPVYACSCNRPDAAALTLRPHAFTANFALSGLLVVRLCLRRSARSRVDHDSCGPWVRRQPEHADLVIRPWRGSGTSRAYSHPSSGWGRRSCATAPCSPGEDTSTTGPEAGPPCPPSGLPAKTCPP
jgi:hypothetical protein